MAPFPGKRDDPRRMPMGTPIRSAIRELVRLTLAVVPRMFRSSLSADNISNKAFLIALPIYSVDTLSNELISALNYSVICNEGKEGRFICKDISTLFLSHYKAGAHAGIC